MVMVAMGKELMEGLSVSYNESTKIKVTRVSGDVENVVIYSDVSNILLETRDFEIIPKGKMKYIDGIRLDVEGQTVEEVGLKCKIGYRQRMQDDIVWSEEFGFSELCEHLFTRFTGRFFRIRIYGATTGAIWKASAIEFYGQVMQGRI